jgi:hypothetical protein
MDRAIHHAKAHRTALPAFVLDRSSLCDHSGRGRQNRMRLPSRRTAEYSSREPQRMGIENPVRVSKLSAGFPADRRRSPPLCAPSCSNRPLPCIKSSTTFRALAPVAFFPWAAKLLLRFQPKNMTQHIFSFESELQNNQACLLDLLL